MKVLKITLVALLVIIGGLVVTIRRLTSETEETKQAAVTPAPPAAAEAARAPREAPAVPEVKPAPVPSKRPAGKVRAIAPAAPTEPARSPGAIEPPAPAPPPAPVRANPSPAPEAPQAPVSPAAPRSVRIPVGTALVVRTQNTLSSERNLRGDTFSVSLEEPLIVDGLVVAEKGANAEGVVVRSEKGGRVEGLSELAIELVRLETSDGQKLSLATDLHQVSGERSRKSDAKKVGITTGLGAIIGAIAGGGKGAAIGAGVGAGAGAGAVLGTRGEQAVISSESRLTFHTKTPVEVTEKLRN